MRIEFGITQQLVHLFEELGRMDMLYLFGNFVYLLPAKAHLFHQEHLGESVLPYDERGFSPPPFCKMQGPVAFIIDQLFLFQLLQEFEIPRA